MENEYGIYQVDTTNWVQSADPLTLIDVNNLPDLNPVELLLFETEEAADAMVITLMDENEEYHLACGPAPIIGSGTVGTTKPK